MSGARASGKFGRASTEFQIWSWSSGVICAPFAHLAVFESQMVLRSPVETTVEHQSCLITLAGTPAATQLSGRFPVTTLFAPTTT